MLIYLKEPLEKRNREVEIEIGDYVRVEEWDGIAAKGIVTMVNDQIISINSAQFLGGVHKGDYSEFENKNEFAFDLSILARVTVSTFEENNPLVLVGRAVRENYCGSEEVVMSPLFHKWYVGYMKDFSAFHSYCQYPIRIDEQLSGYSVYAVPNGDSMKHKISPMKNYTLNFYKSGRNVGFSIFSCFDDELDVQLKEQLDRGRERFGSYKLSANGKVLERGTSAFRLKVHQ